MTPGDIKLMKHRLEEAPRFRHVGTVRRAVGLAVESTGPVSAIGEACRLVGRDGQVLARMEVAGFDGDRVYSMPLERLSGVRAGDRVVALGRPALLPVGPSMLGRILDAEGRALDERPDPRPEARVPVEGTPPSPLSRRSIVEPLPTGVRAIDACTTLGRGQRIGVFAGSGVGKSTLLGMLTRGTEADVTIVALVGERGREVRDFVERDMGAEGLARSVVFVATSDEPPMRRVRVLQAATAAAEYFRDLGKHVVLLVDSLTRVSMAQREIGLSLGEPPAAKGYPPSATALLPRLLERAGSVEHGSITGIYTVYVEADDINDPIGDAARSLLDGHIHLDRKLANRGHYPAIDVLGSVSRLMPQVTDREHVEAQRELRGHLATLDEADDLIALGAYKAGTVPAIDRALELRPAIERLLRQETADRTDWAAMRQGLNQAAGAA